MTALPLMGVLPDRRWQLRTVYQPIIDLDRGTVVGAEAFTGDRTGARSITSMPKDARRDRSVAQLDWLCQLSAVQTWLAARMPTTLALFMNVEPSVVITNPEAFCDPPGQASGTGNAGGHRITERDVFRTVPARGVGAG